MKIQCDVCERATAAVICCADEAALCARCDVEVHAANKLASKHQRLKLGGGSGGERPPVCDICQEKPAFIFCVDDRALFCRDCDEPIHVPGTLSGQHRRFLATGIMVGLASDGAGDAESPPLGGGGFDPPNQAPPAFKPQARQAVPASSSPPVIPSPWAVDELFELSDYDSGDKLQKGSLDWFADIDCLFPDQPQLCAATAAAQVPELRTLPAPVFSRPPSNNTRFKKPRIEVAGAEEDEDYLIVPDLG